MAKKRQSSSNKPLPSKGRRLTKNRKIEIAKLVCKNYETDQFTLLECLKNAGIKSDSTWYRWIEEIEEIEELFKEAQKKKGETYRAGLVQRARTSLERYLDGFIIQIRERTFTPGKPGDEKSPDITIQEKEKEIFVRPSMKAIELVLVNMDGRNFTRNPDKYKAGNEQMPGTVKVEISGNRVKPITSEDDITDIDPSRYL